MALEIRQNRADHTHENEQFRRVASYLRHLFDQKSWEGLLIGNPFNELFSRFRADAILLYNHGIIIVDFKDYKGTIKLPPHEEDFSTTKWYAESETDAKRIEIKAGARFINPFKQLKSYREAMYEVIQNNLYLNNCLDASNICAVNIFSGPIEIQNSVPRNLLYYKIVQETDLGNFLYDYTSKNYYGEDAASALKSIFAADLWEEHINITGYSQRQNRNIEIDSDIKSELSKFLQEDSNGILVLESMDVDRRDDCMRFILSEAVEFKIPQAEVWTHSARIGRKISNRIGMEIHSLYNTIYGGASHKLDDEVSEDEESNNEEHLQEIIPIHSNDIIDKSAVIVLHEAHLVSRSLHQSELLRFGSGRLLQDLLKFLQLENSKRKLICIGDPYSLSYGKDEDSSLNLNTLSDLYRGRIKHYRLPLEDNIQKGRLLLRKNLAKSIDDNTFNTLSYPWEEKDLNKLGKNETRALLCDWYSLPLDEEPQNAVLVYKNKDARNINYWIKSNCLKNGEDLAANDLLLVNNNITIPDKTGFGQPSRLYNGMFLLIKEIGDAEDILIPISQTTKPIILKFIKIRVQCLSLPNNLETKILLLNNYFKSDSHLSKEDEIAFRVLVNKKVGDEIKKNPFEQSTEYKQMHQDSEYQLILKDEENLADRLVRGEKVKTKLDEKKRQKRKIERKYKKRHRKQYLSYITRNDPYVNAVFASYGWAITVHKSLACSFSQVILNAYQGENRGITNSDYYKWLYSAFTTTASQLNVINPQEIHPLMECQFEDQATEANINDNKPKKLLRYPKYQVEEGFKSRIDQSFHENVKGAICELSKLLEQQGYCLETIVNKGDYLNKAYYSIPQSTEKNLIIAINNKGEKDNWCISSIRIERSEGTDEAYINDSISSLFKPIKVEGISNDLKFPTDFRGPIYTRWMKTFGKKGFEMNLNESHPFHDIFEVNHGDSFCKLKIYYNGKGFFTKISIIKKSNDIISDKIEGWLLNGI